MDEQRKTVLINQRDARGLEQGYWEYRDHNIPNCLVKGTFINGMFHGLVEKVDSQTGRPIEKIIYQHGSDIVSAKREVFDRETGMLVCKKHTLTIKDALLGGSKTIREGLYEEYDGETGNCTVRENYDYGKRHGLREVFDAVTGFRAFSAEYLNGKPQGWVSYYDPATGDFDYEEYFENGQKTRTRLSEGQQTIPKIQRPYPDIQP